MYAYEYVNEEADQIMKFVVFTHVKHRQVGRKYAAYAPYVREMNVWFKHVDEVEVLAPYSSTDALGQEEYQETVRFTPVPAFNFLSPRNTLRSLFVIPLALFKIFSGMRRADHLHLRCPGNIGLLACICQIFFPAKPKTAKYAGNWDPSAVQPWTYNLQKWILNNTFLTRNMKVLVYGKWEGQSRHIRPFFTASFSERDIPEKMEKDLSKPLRFIFVGNLVRGKRPLQAIKLIEELQKTLGMKRKLLLEIYGDGPERSAMEDYCRSAGIETLVTFKGTVTIDDLKNTYKRAHFLILLSRSEGWPKAIAEAMFYGCIPVATSISCVPWMLGHGSRGLIWDTRGERKEKIDLREGQRKLEQLIDHPLKLERMSKAAMKWSHQYTFEKFDGSIQEVLKNGKPISEGFKHL